MENRCKAYHFTQSDLVIMGMPVYAGRVPNKILPSLSECFAGNGAKVIPVSVYGNRSFDDGLMELKLALEDKGFRTIGAAAVASQHAFSNILAAGRPDEQDLTEIKSFTERVAENIKEDNADGIITVEGNNPVMPYYTPLKEDGTPAKFLKAKPVTDTAKCVSCGLCSAVCPMGSIDDEDFSLVEGVCIKCQACVKGCPQGAKVFKDEEFLSHVKMLEKNYQRRGENHFFVN